MTDAGAIAVGGGKSNAQLAYVLLLLGLVSGGLAAIVGVAMAYVSKRDAPEWLRTHYAFVIHTFWVGVLGLAVSLITAGIVMKITYAAYGLWAGAGAGGIVWLLVLVWWILRCVRGLDQLRKDKPIPHPRDWALVH